MRQFNFTPTPNGNYSALEKLRNDIHKTFTQSPKIEQNLKLQQSKKRIQNALSQMEEKSSKQQQQQVFATDLLLSTKSAIIEHIRVLQPNQKNMDAIEKNLEKLFILQEDLQQIEQTKETKQLLWKIEMKISQQINLTKQTKDDKKCQICFDKEREYVVIPCGHYIYCEQCKQIIKDTCLLCRKPVTQVLKIYQ